MRLGHGTAPVLAHAGEAELVATMSDKTKQAARALQRETGMNYRTCRNIVTGELRPIPQNRDCSIVRAISLMPEKLRARIPELGSQVAGKPAPVPCTCARCEP